MAKKRDKVHVVTAAKGEHVPGDVIKRNDDGTIDVEIIHQGEPMLITSSPHDPAGEKHDSYHEIEPEAAAATAGQADDDDQDPAGNA